MGERLRSGFDKHARKHGFTLRQTGPAQMPLILFNNDGDMRLGYHWCSRMVAHGVYVHPWHNMFLSAAMTDENIDFALVAAEEEFPGARASCADAADRIRAIRARNVVERPNHPCRRIPGPN